MTSHLSGHIAVIFVARRTGADEAGYQQAAAVMNTLAAQQPGYVGVDSVRHADGQGITVSYWESEDAANAWRDHPEHKSIRDTGREVWYSEYSLHVAAITRSYDWALP